MKNKELAKNAGVSLKPSQIKYLDDQARKWQLNRSQALRKIIDNYRERSQPVAS